MHREYIYVYMSSDVTIVVFSSGFDFNFFKEVDVYFDLISIFSSQYSELKI